MKVIITVAFEGYPEGDDKPSVHYVPAKDAIEVPDEFGSMIVGKGLALADAAAPAAAVATETHQDQEH